MRTKLQLLLFMLMLGISSFAQVITGPGEIDNTFNSSGVGAYGGTPPPASLNGSADGNVYKSKVYGPLSPNKDKILIIGRFTSYNGVAREYIARLNADGTLDPTFVGPNFGANQYIYCLEILANDEVIIGGGFSITYPVAGVNITVNNVTKLLPNGSLDTSFNPTPATSKGANNVVHALVKQGNKILVGGGFTSYNNSSGTRRVIRINTNGTPDNTFGMSGTVNNEVRALAIQNIAGENKIIVGGFFTGFSETSGINYNKGRVLRLNEDGTYDPTFNVGGSGANSDVYDLFVKSNNRIYVVGSFGTFNGATRRGIVFLETNGIPMPQGSSFDYGTNNITGVGPGQFIFAITVQPDNKIIIGGNFTTYGTNTTIPKGIARLNSNGTFDGTFLTGGGFTGGTNVYQGISVIRNIQFQSDGKIIAGGDFDKYDGTARRMICRIKTRECPYSAVYYQNTGWDGFIEPTSSDYYMSVAGGTLTIPSGTHYQACELEIKEGATLKISTNASLTVKGVVMNNGTFIIDNAGSLVQIKDDAVNADLGDGIFNLKRDTAPVTRFDYTYWSSPVEQQLSIDVSPNTLVDKFFKYRTDLAIPGWGLPINPLIEYMTPGRGYIIRAPQTFSTTTPAIYTATFKGRPNNGVIITPIAAGKWNLIGNPYPSAINVDTFLDSNASIVGGTIYMWTHNTPLNPGSGNYQYTSNDYAAYNRTAGTVTAPTGTPFAGKIASGQGFFVHGIANANANFNNSMRVTGVNNNNTQFYRQAANLNNVQHNIESNDKSRLWINFSNAQGAFKQAVLGYVAGATDGIDNDYDGVSFNGNSYVNFYSITEEQNLTIQGRALPFNEDQVIPLGYSTTVAGTFTISLADYDGLFGNNAVYLVDKMLNLSQALKAGSYTFTTVTGTHNDRFELRFAKELPSTEIVYPDGIVAISSERKSVQVKSTESMTSITIYDLSGKVLVNKNSLDTLEVLIENLNVQQSIVIVKVQMDNNQEITKKIMIN